MALANLAALLALRGRRVFTIDFDLEAPGLDSFKELGIEAKKPGVVEYAHEFQKTRIAPDLAPYIQECKFPKPLRGKVWLMSSGKKDESYNAKRIALNWEELYSSDLGEPFIANWKAAIHRLFKPDYVFVDSRTGLTDVGGICTLHLPDLVVLLFGLNDQNLHGTAAVLQTIRDAPSPRPPQVLPVATPVPDWPREEEGLLQARFKAAEELLGLKIESVIHYNPYAALVEKLFTLESQSRGAQNLLEEIKLKLPRSNPIAAEYAGLLEEILKRDEKGLDSLIRKAREACSKDDEATAIEVRQALLDDFSDRADALFHVGQVDRLFRGREEAVEWWRKAIEAEPTHQPAFEALVNHYKLKKQLDDVIALYTRRLEQTAKLDPDRSSAMQRELGEQLMVVGRYADAARAYHGSLDEYGDQDADTRLVILFNLNESERRRDCKPNTELCRQLVNVWEKDITLQNQPLTLQANKLQAMHIPYACLGRLSIAKELLEKARRCASAVGKIDRLFSVKTYTNVSVEEFVAANDEMVSALDGLKLWDGMPLPAEKVSD